MRSSVLPSKTTPFLRDPEFKRKLQQLRRGNNTTNWVYLIRTYLMLVLIIGATVGFYRCGAAAGWPILWNLQATLFAIVAVGTLQHHLACLTHEAAHNALFKSRYLTIFSENGSARFP